MASGVAVSRTMTRSAFAVAVGALALLLGASAWAQQSAPLPLPTPALTVPPPSVAPIPPPAAPPFPAPVSTPAPAAAPPHTAPDAAGLPVPVEPASPPKPKKKIVRAAPPLETALSDDPAPTLQLSTAAATARALDTYRAIDQAGGWPVIARPLRPGDKGDAVAVLRKRLAVEGDLAPALAADGPASLNWDDDVAAAVKHFQARMGLRKTGIVAGATFKAMNVPASERARQLAASEQRLAGMDFGFGDRYVVVNIPSLSVEAVESGRIAHRYVAIVGGVEHASPEISAHIQVINLNPTWTVPTSIIKKEIIPRMQRDPGYLTRAKIRILDSAGGEVDPKNVDWNSQRAVSYTLRQDSGAGNSLGSIRIGMPNKLSVYMHDTPSKGLFGADYRFLSHGCVRVQGVYDLAEWLLQGTPGGWDKKALTAKVKDGAREDIKLAQSVPVIWVYLTGWSNGEGGASFRTDVYDMDSATIAAASALPATPEPASFPAQ
jgi:murein L,D-transpeptidase YcbB/YkuD